MSYLRKKKYSFISNALDEDTFGVVEFHGEEGLSRLYHFEITLVTEDADIELGAVVQSGARLIIHRDEGDDVVFNGVISHFEQLHGVDEYVFYRASLVPRLWYLTLTHHNQVFLDKDIKEILEIVLKDGGLTGLDYEFRLQGEYKKMEYICQYGESHFNFINRWCEREGIYYFFEQGDDREKIIFTDTKISHIEKPNGGAVRYSPPSGMGEEHRREMVQGFICRHNTLPQKVMLRDYNYRKPSLEVTGSALVDERGRGVVYYYGEHFRSPEEGNRLAKIRAEELLCRKEEFIGDSTVPYIQPGYTFTLEDHYRGSFNRRYLTIEVSHEGSQTGYLISGIQKGLSGREERVYYQNHFTAIPADVQFRPERKAERPKIVGTLNAKVDGTGSGQYAELDDEGRYKVILPFDISGRKDGKASAWLRMLQPYAGSNHGMHFPLHKGAEVLLTFIDGNPDRPVIAGAVPNPENPSPVTSEDQTMCKITTSGGNKIHMEDQEGKQRILLHSPTANTFIRLGSHNDPGDDDDDYKDVWGKEWKKKDGLRINSGGSLEILAGGAKVEVVLGAENSVVGGLENSIVLGASSDILLGGKVEIHVPKKWTFEKTELKSTVKEIKANVDEIKVNVDEITEIKNNITIIQNNVNNVVKNETDISEIVKQVKEQVLSTIKTETQIAEAKKEIIKEVQSMVENETKALKQSISTVETSIATVKKDIQETKNSLKKVSTEIKKVGTKISDAGNQFQKAENEVLKISGSHLIEAATFISKASAIFLG